MVDLNSLFVFCTHAGFDQPSRFFVVATHHLLSSSSYS